MAWPKGKPRKPKTESEGSNQPQEQAKPSSQPAPRRLMKARPNWDTYDGTEDSEDRLHIARDLFPPGFDFQWVTDSVYGQAQPQHRAQFERKGWTPVHQEDFDGVFDGKFMPKGAEGEINVDGLVLMARPLESSMKAKREDHLRAREAVLIKQQQLTGGDLPGVSLDSRHVTATRSNKINITVEPIPIPRDGE